MYVDGRVKKVGIKEIQREGFEYELTVNFNIDRDSHAVTASKDNTRIFEGQDPFVITEKTGETLRDWVASGKADETAEKKKEIREKIKTLAGQLGKTVDWVSEQVGGNVNLMTVEELERVVKMLEKTIDSRKPKTILS